MAPYEALYGQPCRSPWCWAEHEDRITLSTEIIKEISEKIKVVQDRLRIAQSRQKSYVDERRQPLEFQVGNFVFLKVFPQKGVNRLEVKGKLAPIYIGSFKISEHIGPVAYRLDLPPELSYIHNVFHISQLKKSAPDIQQIMPWVNLPLE